MEIIIKEDQKEISLETETIKKTNFKKCLFDIIHILAILFISIYEIYIWQNYELSICEENLILFITIHGICNLYGIWLYFLITYYGQKTNIIMTIWGLFNCSMLIWGTVILSRINSKQHVCPSEIYNFMWGIFGILLCNVNGLVLFGYYSRS